MHKLKRAAKRDAWYNDDGSTNFNPFGKLWRPSSRFEDGSRGFNSEADIEAGLGRSQTDGDVVGLTEAERQRREEYGEQMQHAQTAPSQRPASHSGSHSSQLPNKERAEETRESNTDSSKTEVPAPEASTETGGSNGEVRHRKMGGLLSKLHKDKDAEPEEDEDKKPKQKFTVWSQFQHTIFNSPINILLLMAPVGIALKNVNGISGIVVFVVNFIAIIPLAGLLSFATEEIALRTGETIGGLLNATFGNAVELIVSLFALFDNQYVIVQTSLIGSMLSNLLLVMGMCFFFGGLNKVEQHFNVTVAQTAASLLALAIGSLIIPTVFSEIVGQNVDPDPSDNTPIDPNKELHLQQMSHGTSILLLLTYAAYLYFQLSTHADMYAEPSKKATRRKPKSKKKGDALKSMVRVGQQASNQGSNQATRDDDDDDDEEEPKLSLTTALITLAGSTALVAVCAEYMVDGIGAVTGPGTGVSQEFVGLILLPIVGNAAEHATAVTVAVKDKMDLAIGVAVGSSMQIALLVLPLVIVIGWISGHGDLTLAFDGFQVIVLFVAVLLVNYLIGDGKSHWLEGVLLQFLYLIIAIAAWFYPTKATAAG